MTGVTATTITMICEPAFSMQPASGTYVIVGEADDYIKYLHYVYSQQIQSSQGNNKEGIASAYKKVILEAKLKTGYTKPFFLPGPDWKIAVMKNDIKLRFTHDN